MKSQHQQTTGSTHNVGDGVKKRPTLRQVATSSALPWVKAATEGARPPLSFITHFAPTANQSKCLEHHHHTKQPHRRNVGVKDDLWSILHLNGEKTEASSCDLSSTTRQQHQQQQRQQPHNTGVVEEEERKGKSDCVGGSMKAHRQQQEEDFPIVGIPPPHISSSVCFPYQKRKAEQRAATTRRGTVGESTMDVVGADEHTTTTDRKATGGGSLCHPQQRTTTTCRAGTAARSTLSSMRAAQSFASFVGFDSPPELPPDGITRQEEEVKRLELPSSLSQETTRARGQRVIANKRNNCTFEFSNNDDEGSKTMMMMMMIQERQRPHSSAVYSSSTQRQGSFCSSHNNRDRALIVPLGALRGASGAAALQQSHVREPQPQQQQQHIGEAAVQQQQEQLVKELLGTDVQFHIRKTRWGENSDDDDVRGKPPHCHQGNIKKKYFRRKVESSTQGEQKSITCLL